MTAIATGAAEGRARSGFVTSCVVLILILFSEGLVQRLVAPEIEADGNVILRFMWLPVYGGVLALAATRWREILALVLRTPCLMAVVALAAASFLWSVEPSLSFRRGISVSMTTLFGLYLTARHDWRELLMMLGGVWLFLAAASFIAGALAPGFARMHEIHPGTWRGFWFEKNTMGGHMARAAALFAILAALDERRRWLWVGGIALAIALVLLTTSATSLLGTMLGLSIVAGGVMALRSPVTAVALVWLGVTLVSALAAVFWFAPEMFFNVLGKDATLTGRTDIWAALGDAIAARPWLGYGYGAFWGPDSEPADWVRKAVDWDAPTAHNGWLDISLSVGLIGLALFVVSFAATTARAVALMFRHRFGLYAITMLATMMLFSLSESILLEPNSLIWATYVAVASMLARGVAPDVGVKRQPARVHRADRRAGAAALEL